MSQIPRRRRDPEARRAAIVSAAAELIMEVGVDAITHRMVAARAEVPLGATTQYFATLDELREQALQLLGSFLTKQVSQMKEVLITRGATSEVISELLLAELADARRMHADRAVVTAAVRDPRLRELTSGWVDQIVEILEPQYGRDRAIAVTIFIEGTMSRSFMTDDAIPKSTIRSALADLLGENRH